MVTWIIAAVAVFLVYILVVVLIFEIVKYKRLISKFTVVITEMERQFSELTEEELIEHIVDEYGKTIEMSEDSPRY